MAERHEDAIALLAKIELAEQTDAAPTGALNAMLAKNVAIEPLLGTDIRRGVLRKYRGHQGLILTGHYAKLTFDIEMAGAGAAGDAPAYGVMMRAAGLAETITPDTDVVYSKISTGYESATLHYFLDGVRHVLLGSRGKLTIPEMQGLQLPHFRYEMWGIAGTITDQPMPVEDLDAFVTPLPLGEGTTTLALHGVSLPAERLAIDFGNQVETRFLLNRKGIKIVDHEVTGSVTLQADTLAVKDWFGIARANPPVTGALAFQHGTVAGNIVKVDAAKVQIGRPGYGATQKIVNSQLPLIIQPTNGNDDITITVK